MKKADDDIGINYEGRHRLMLAILWAVIAAAVICIALLPADTYQGFTLFLGRKVYFWTDCLITLIGLCLLGLFIVRIVYRKKRTKLFIIGTGLLMLAVALVTGVFAFEFIHDIGTSVPEIAFKSPDGKHILYYDGGDSDIFGFSSGYGHYVQKAEGYQYKRVFYCFEDEYEPQIEWAENGFYVMKRCPGGNPANNSDLVPESYDPFPWEEYEDRYFFYYEPKETAAP